MKMIMQCGLLTAVLSLANHSFAESTEYQDIEGEKGQQKQHSMEQKKGKRKRAYFNKLDVNNDGNVSWEEFQQHKKNRGKRERMFNHIDANNDGSISKQEFRDHKPPRHKQGHREKMESFDIEQS
mgnify:CR=1 FL=1